MTTVMQDETREQDGVVVEKTAIGSDKAAEARQNITAGAFWFVLGVLVTAGTYSAAGPGETYVVAWGAILFGGLQCLKGFVQYIRWG